MILTNTGGVLACGNNEHNKLGLDVRYGILLAKKRWVLKRFFPTQVCCALRRIKDGLCVLDVDGLPFPVHLLAVHL
jgi:phosphopantetheinyl transferase